MNVPAHTNIDPHGDNDGLIIDYYENYFGYDFYWDYQNTYSQVGGYINPYQSSNPLHFLMYTTNQMANHFATQGPHYKPWNDNFWGNSSSEEINYLNSQNVYSFGVPTSINGPFDNNSIINVRNHMFPQAIRATAGLLYWFAKEADLLPQPLVSVSLGGDVTLYEGVTGHWYVGLINGIEPFTYNWQIMYLDGAGYLQSYESVKKEKEKKDKEKKKDGDIIIETVPSNEWIPIGTNSPEFSKPHNPYDLRDFKLRCIVTDATNTTKTSNELYVDVVSYPPPEFSIVQSNYEKQETSLAKEHETTQTPINYFLEQNYPNPFNPSTAISYKIKEKGFVSLKVYGVIGREIADLINETQEAGSHSVMFNADNLPSGVYIYTLRVNNFVQNKKMILLR
ncbi:T9SS type A sorting domain-containing protein [Melioribacteraceae bacterium 4301-Me]|uniref:T9SS type A sorting domain-containing protein n=1 Tax=Pyranulibacter aquaticus TaxID=3163344 RepID=UPI0035970259